MSSGLDHLDVDRDKSIHESEIGLFLESAKESDIKSLVEALEKTGIQDQLKKTFDESLNKFVNSKKDMRLSDSRMGRVILQPSDRSLLILKGTLDKKIGKGLSDSSLSDKQLVDLVLGNTLVADTKIIKVGSQADIAMKQANQRAKDIPLNNIALSTSGASYLNQQPVGRGPGEAYIASQDGIQHSVQENRLERAEQERIIAETKMPAPNPKEIVDMSLRVQKNYPEEWDQFMKAQDTPLTKENQQTLDLKIQKFALRQYMNHQGMAMTGLRVRFFGSDEQMKEEQNYVRQCNDSLSQLPEMKVINENGPRLEKEYYSRLKHLFDSVGYGKNPELIQADKKTYEQYATELKSIQDDVSSGFDMTLLASDVSELSMTPEKEKEINESLANIFSGTIKIEEQRNQLRAKYGEKSLARYEEVAHWLPIVNEKYGQGRAEYEQAKNVVQQKMSQFDTGRISKVNEYRQQVGMVTNAINDANYNNPDSFAARNLAMNYPAQATINAKNVAEKQEQQKFDTWFAGLRQENMTRTAALTNLSPVGLLYNNQKIAYNVFSSLSNVVMNTPKQLLDAGMTAMAGLGANKYAVEDTMQSYGETLDNVQLRQSTGSKQQMFQEGFFNGGNVDWSKMNFNVENVSSQVTTSVGDMLKIIVLTRGIASLGVSTGASLFTAGMLQSTGANFREYLASDFSGQEAALAAVLQSSVSSSLERINMGPYLSGTGATIFSKGPFLKNFLKAAGKDMLGENVQEISQTIGDSVMKNLANAWARDGKANGSISVEEILNTIVITTLTTGIVGAKGHLDNADQPNAMNSVLERAKMDPGQVENYLANLQKNEGKTLVIDGKPFTVTPDFIHKAEAFFVEDVGSDVDSSVDMEISDVSGNLNTVFGELQKGLGNSLSDIYSLSSEKISSLQSTIIDLTAKISKMNGEDFNFAFDTSSTVNGIINGLPNVLYQSENILQTIIETLHHYPLMINLLLPMAGLISVLGTRMMKGWEGSPLKEKVDTILEQKVDEIKSVERYSEKSQFTKEEVDANAGIVDNPTGPALEQPRIKNYISQWKEKNGEEIVLSEREAKGIMAMHAVAGEVGKLTREQIKERVEEGMAAFSDRNPKMAEKMRRFAMESGLSGKNLEINHAPDRNTEQRESYEIFRDREVVAIGDLHGNIEAYKQNLLTANVIDVDGNWIGGNRNIIFHGDILADRNTTGFLILEQIHSLREQAREQGGDVKVLAGNHEDFLISFLIDRQPADFIGTNNTLTGKSAEKGLQELLPFLGSDTNVDDLFVKGNNKIILDAMKESEQGKLILNEICKLELVQQIDDTLFFHVGPDENISPILEYAIKGSDGKIDVGSGVDAINSIFQGYMRKKLLGENNTIDDSEAENLMNKFLTGGFGNDETKNEEAISKLKKNGINHIMHGHQPLMGKHETIGGVSIVGNDYESFKSGTKSEVRSLSVIQKNGEVLMGLNQTQLYGNELIVPQEKIEQLDEKTMIEYEERLKESFQSIDTFLDKNSEIPLQSANYIESVIGKFIPEHQEILRQKLDSKKVVENSITPEDIDQSPEFEEFHKQVREKVLLVFRSTPEYVQSFLSLSRGGTVISTQRRRFMIDARDVESVIPFSPFPELLRIPHSLNSLPLGAKYDKFCKSIGQESIKLLSEDEIKIAIEKYNIDYNMDIKFSTLKRISGYSDQVIRQGYYLNEKIAIADIDSLFKGIPFDTNVNNKFNPAITPINFLTSELSNALPNGSDIPLTSIPDIMNYIIDKFPKAIGLIDEKRLEDNLPEKYLKLKEKSGSLESQEAMRKVFEIRSQLMNQIKDYGLNIKTRGDIENLSMGFDNPEIHKRTLEQLAKVDAQKKEQRIQLENQEKMKNMEADLQPIIKEYFEGKDPVEQLSSFVTLSKDPTIIEQLGLDKENVMKFVNEKYILSPNRKREGGRLFEKNPNKYGNIIGTILNSHVLDSTQGLIQNIIWGISDTPEYDENANIFRKHLKNGYKPNIDYNEVMKRIVEEKDITPLLNQ